MDNRDTPNRQYAWYADLACEQTNRWTSMYDFVSIGLYATDLFPNGQFDDGVFGAGDGINEHGLTVSQQTARLSVYEDSEPTTYEYMLLMMLPPGCWVIL